MGGGTGRSASSNSRARSGLSTAGLFQHGLDLGHAQRFRVAFAWRARLSAQTGCLLAGLFFGFGKPLAVGAEPCACGGAFAAGFSEGLACGVGAPVGVGFGGCGVDHAWASSAEVFSACFSDRVQPDSRESGLVAAARSAARGAARSACR